jgi:alpha-D-ribose 1-methylphosphonate 5-triphosphate diphosphatase
MKHSRVIRILSIDMRTMVIRGNRVLLENGEICRAGITCGGGQIREVKAGDRFSFDYDARDLLILPGIVDIHGDAFERQVHPRPRIGVPLDIALADTDRQMISSGITTAYHGVTVTWEPGSRDIDSARTLFDALDRMGPRLRCDTRVHLRHEVLSLDTVDDACSWMRAGRIALFAINDHGHMAERLMSQGPGARRDTVSISGEEYAQVARKALARRHEVPESLWKLTSVARECGIPLASHDDESPEMRSFFRDLGCTLCEFPADRPTADAAVQAGDSVILGSPNILRGGSHCGRVTAAEMIRDGLCTILCSDYYYPSVLAAPFWLAANEVVSFERAWDLVSRAPARAAKLDDRGIIAPQHRADLLFVNDRDPMNPEVRAVFVNGTLVHAANPETCVPQVVLQ